MVRTYKCLPYNNTEEPLKLLEENRQFKAMGKGYSTLKDENTKLMTKIKALEAERQ